MKAWYLWFVLSSYLSKSSNWAYLTWPFSIPTFNLLTFDIGLPSLSTLIFLFLLLLTLVCFLGSICLPILSFFFSVLTSNLDLFSNLSFGAFFLDVSTFFLDVLANGLPSLSTLNFLFLLLWILLCFLGSTCLPILSFFFSVLTSNLALFSNLSFGAFV